MRRMVEGAREETGSAAHGTKRAAAFAPSGSLRSPPPPRTAGEEPGFIREIKRCVPRKRGPGRTAPAPEWPTGCCQHELRGAMMDWRGGVMLADVAVRTADSDPMPEANPSARNLVPLDVLVSLAVAPTGAAYCSSRRISPAS